MVATGLGMAIAEYSQLLAIPREAETGIPREAETGIPRDLGAGE